jgi:hypothetical protein
MLQSNQEKEILILSEMQISQELKLKLEKMATYPYLYDELQQQHLILKEKLELSEK